MVFAVSVYSDEKAQVRFREAIYYQDICQDPAPAIDILESIISNIGNSSIRAEVYYRLVRAYLDLRKFEQAEHTFREFSNQYLPGDYWMQLCRDIIPTDFLMRDLPWKDHTSYTYKWETFDGEVIGYSIVDVTSFQDEEKTQWRIHSRMLGDGFRKYKVHLDQKTLSPVYSNYQLRRSNSAEDLWRARWVSDRAKAIQHDWDYETIGLLLNLYQLRLGIPVKAQMYKPSEGRIKSAEIELTGIETLESYTGSVEACSKIEVRFSDLKVVFWLSNSGTGNLLKFETENFQGTLIQSHSGKHNLFHEVSPGLSSLTAKSQQYDAEHLFLSEALSDSIWIGRYADLKPLAECQHALYSHLNESGFDKARKYEDISDSDNFNIGFEVVSEDESTVVLWGISGFKGNVFEYIVSGDVQSVDIQKQHLKSILRILQLEDLDL